MLVKIALFVTLFGFVCAADESEDEKWMLSDTSDTSASQDHDVPVGDLAELRRIAADRGFNTNDLLTDASFLTGIPGIFENGDAKRFTTLNFGYQLACYEGQGGPFVTQALWAMLRFNGYGCYCGGGHYYGNYLDATDNCCRHHDLCYDRVMAKYKLRLGCQTYTTTYSVSCCKDQKYTKCTDSGPSAGRELCECDQAMARCTARNSGSYNKKLLDDRSRCSGPATKALSAWEVLKSCKHAFTPIKKFPISYGYISRHKKQLKTRTE